MTSFGRSANPDKQSKEFALSPDGYKSYAKQFGNFSQYYIIGKSTPEKDWPYCLPGSVDEWAGVGYYSWRKSVQQVLFDVREVPASGTAKLTIDLLAANSLALPVFRVTVNEHFKKDFRFTSPVKAIEGDLSSLKSPQIVIEIPYSELKQGANVIRLENREGSWILFDYLKLEATGIKLAPVTDTHIMDVKMADFELAQGKKKVQPLLLNIWQEQGSEPLTLTIDGKDILTQAASSGKSILEFPLAAVSQKQSIQIAIKSSKGIILNKTLERHPAPLQELSDYVDQLMGTTNSRWMIAPGPWMPYSMVKIAPDNENARWKSGYDYEVESIGCFSHLHEWTMSGLGTMPVTGKLITTVGTQDDPNSGFRSAIDKKEEKAEIGYYKVKLKRYDIQAELTATTRCSFQRYTFPKTDSARIMLPLLIPAEYRYSILDAEIKQTSPTEITGYSKQNHGPVNSYKGKQEFTMHFVIQFDKPMKGFGGWIDKTVKENITVLKGTGDIGAYAAFSTNAGEQVKMRIGISLVSLDNARENLKTEISTPFDWNFEAVVKNQRQVWNNLLSRVSINTNDHLQKVKFYTNLYRAFSGRNTFSDSNGQWISESGKVQQTDKSFNMLAGDAFWGTHWNLNQLWNMVWPETGSAWVKTQLEMFRSEGWTSRGNPGLRYIGVMTGASEVPQMVSTWQSGIRDYNANQLYNAVHHQQNNPGQYIPSGGWVGNEDNAMFLKHGYVPFGKGQYNSNTMEYSYQQWAAGQLFKSMGKDSEAAEHIRRGNGWQLVFDKSTGWTRPQTESGEWWKPGSGEYNPSQVPRYCEGSAWQWTWHVPHDMSGLVGLMGKERFTERLEAGMEESKKVNFMALADMMSTTYVNHGNQVIMQASWMFNYAGSPWLTQEWTRSILDKYYGVTPYDAYPGDEDQGQMSAWLILSSIGLFQMDGGASADTYYEIGSPLYPKITIDLGERYGRRKSFTIIANNTSSVNKYVQKAVLNGKELNSFKFPAKELWKGGTLELSMGAEPNKNWGL